ncbi:MAG TPA: hypothetical protein PLW43_00325 [Chitinophagales bacterium]|nr:hypothetical protein [Chitinophagales bacterium]
MKTINIQRTVCSIAVFMFMLFTQSCKKDNVGPNGSNSGFDERVIGSWQHQEILGEREFTQTFVDEITFRADGTGFEETFDIGSAGQSPRQRVNFTWSRKPNNVLSIRFDANNVFDIRFTITDSGEGMAMTSPNGTRKVFTRMN